MNDTDAALTIRPLQTAAEWAALLDLRARVLRANQPPETARFVGDDAPDTVHLGAFAGGRGEQSKRDERIVGVASLMRENGIRLRGMAVEPDWRGRGVGAALLGRAHEIATTENETLWCHARESARGFYERLNWSVEGDRFDVFPIGPHFVMCWRGPAFTLPRR